MKRLTALILSAMLLLSLTACGSAPAAEPAAEPADLAALYESYVPSLPSMFQLDGDTLVNFLGIQAEDCTQVIAAITADGLAADEVWLIEAKDQEALDRLKDLAENRMAAKAAETVDYLPDQYLIVEKGVILTEGLYLALLVSPEVEAFQTAFEEAVK